MAKKTEQPTFVTFQDLSSGEIAEARTRGTAAAEEAASSLREMHQIMGSLDQVELLARLAFLMIIGIQNFETGSEGPNISVHELELLQLLALSHPRSAEADHMMLSEAVHQLIGHAPKYTSAFRDQALRNLEDEDTKNRFEAILERIRTTTHTVRGPRHAYQTRAYLRDLACELDACFLAGLGFTASDLIDVIDDFLFAVGRRLSALRAAHARWMRAKAAEQCIELILEDNPQFARHAIIAYLKAEPRPFDEVKAALFAIFEEQYRAVFRFKLPQGEDNRKRALRAYLQDISLSFGDVDPEALARLPLVNTVRCKPILRTGDDEYYLFCTQTLFSNLVEMIEDLAEPHPRLSMACRNFKARWLERKLEVLLHNAFPDGDVIANAKWQDATGKDGETDAILCIDQTLAIFEAKSGKITPPARRGAKDRLKREIGELLVEPSRQSARLVSTLRASGGLLPVRLPSGPAAIDPAPVREVIRINILFDTLGPLTASTNQLVKAGFIAVGEPMAPSMSIFELETLLELLPDQISRLHYLRRRAELERDALFEADEMDLIALYLECSFCLADLGPDIWGFGIYGWSDRVARLYDHEGRRPGKPIALKRTAFWSELLATLEQRHQPGWTRFGYRLSNVTYRDQWAVQRNRDAIAKRARRVKRGQAVNTGVYSADGSKKLVIGLCVGKDVSAFGIAAHATTTARAITETAGADECLVLYWDVTDKSGACRFVASFVREGTEVGVLRRGD